MIDPDLAAGWQRRLEDRLGQFAVRDLAGLFAPAEDRRAAAVYVTRPPRRLSPQPRGGIIQDSTGTRRRPVPVLNVHDSNRFGRFPS